MKLRVWLLLTCVFIVQGQDTTSTAPVGDSGTATSLDAATTTDASLTTGQDEVGTTSPDGGTSVSVPPGADESTATTESDDMTTMTSPELSTPEMTSPTVEVTTILPDATTATLGVVTNIMVVGYTPWSISISWGEAEHAQAYMVAWVVASDPSVQHLITTNTSAVLSPLAPGKMYTILVAACRDSECQGDVQSDPASIEQATRPNYPEILAVEALNSTTLNITWRHNNTGINAAEFTVTAQPDNDTSEVPKKLTVSADSDGKTMYNGTVGGLTPGEQYTVTVAAWTDLGASGESSNDSATGQTMLAAPCNVQVVDTEGETMDITWDPAAGFWDTYMVQCISLDGGDDSTGSDLLRQSFTCKSLVPGSAYEVQVSTVKPNYTMEVCPDDCACVAYGVTVPEPVENLVLTPINSMSIEVTWIKPLSGYASNYLVTWYEAAEGTAITTNVPANTTRYVVTGLAGDQQYTIKVRAQTVYGNITNESVPEEANSTTYSAEVSDVTVEEEPDALEVTWRRPVDNGGDSITAYILSALDGDDCLRRTVLHLKNEEPADIPEDDLNCTESIPEEVASFDEVTYRLSDLESCVTYDLDFKVINVAGVSQGEQHDATTETADPMSPVTGITFDEITNTTMSLSWVRPEQPARCPIVLYTVNYTYENCSNLGQVLNRSDEVVNTSAIIKDLEPYWNYTFVVYAYTDLAGGVGDSASDPLSRLTLQSAPEAPASLEVESITADEATLTWTPPDPCDVNGVIQNYTLTYSCWALADQPGDCVGVATTTAAGNQGEILDYPANVTSVTVPVGPLQRCRFDVAATTIETGPAITVEKNTGQLPPYPVTELSADPTNTSVMVNWSLPSNYTGPTNYTVKVSEVGIVDPFEEIVEGFCSTEAVVDGLTPYIEYEVIVDTVAFGSTSSESETFTTLQAAPPMVSDFEVLINTDDCYQVILTWTGITGRERNGVINKYIVHIESNVTDDNREQDYTVEDPDQLEYQKVLPLSAESSFALKIKAVTEYPGEWSAPVEKQLGACTPRQLDGESMTVTSVISPSIPTQDNIDTDHQFRIQIMEHFFTDTTYGAIIDKGLIVASTNAATGNSETQSYEAFKRNYNTGWQQVKDESPMPYYRATPDPWDPFSAQGRRKRQAGNDQSYVNFVIGEDRNCDQGETYCNGFVQSGGYYKVKAFVCTRGGCRITAYSSSIFSTTNDNSMDIIITVVVLLVLVILVLGALLLWRMRFHHRKTTSSRRENTGIENYGMDTTELHPSADGLSQITVILLEYCLARHEEDFRVLVIPGHTHVAKTERKVRMQRKSVPPPRYKSMRLDQDWTSAWPAAETFKWSAVPFPVRQGFVDRNENSGVPPAKYANAELMKIPNFLHLTPNHIKKHCAAIKQFCTEWPAGLETTATCDHHFPVTVTTSDYVLDGPSLRDKRSRGVTLKLKLSSLDLDYHARDKFIRLVGERYDATTDMLTMTTDRCPTRKQNYDYAMYLITAVYFESWKTEVWESEKTEEDMERYVWDITASKPAVLRTLRLQKQLAQQAEETSVPSVLDSLSESVDEANVVELPEVREYKQAISDLHDMGEDLHTLEQYKKAALKLLLKLPESNKS